MSELHETAKRLPNKKAIINASTGESITYKDLDIKSNKLAHFLTDTLPEGARFAVLAKNDIPFYIAMRAAVQSKIRMVPINYHLKPEEAKYILTNSDSMGIIVAPEFMDLANEITKDVDLVFNFKTTDIDTVILDMPSTPLESDLYAGLMYYSSGTSGKPKGILRQLAKVPVDLVDSMEADENTVFFSGCPIYHILNMPSSNCTFRKGGTVIASDKFDAEKTLQYIDKYKVTNAMFVSTHFVRILQLPEDTRLKYDMSSLKMVTHGATSCPVPVKEKMIEWWGPVIYEIWGSTENLGYARISSEEWLEHKGSVGKGHPLSGNISIVDDEGNDVAVGEVGHIVTDTPIIFEYHKDPDNMNNLFRTKDGRTGVGDKGYMDEEGYIYITDRSINLIKSGGVSIFPKEAEDIISSHTAVRDVAVIGVPNAEYGEEVKAVIELTEGYMPSEDLAKELIAYTKLRLSSFKCPKTVDFIEELPRLPTGKMLKRELRERYWK